MWRPLFESYVIADLMKQWFNKGLNSKIYFWRDQSDYEIDCIVESPGFLVPKQTPR